jgi:hypothetical protein
MRATVLYDQDGVVLAAAIHDRDDYQGPRPVARSESESVDELEIPETLLRGRTLDEVFRSARVDVERRRLVLGDDESPTSPLTEAQ